MASKTMERVIAGLFLAIGAVMPWIVHRPV